MVDISHILRTTRSAVDNFRQGVPRRKQFTYRLALSSIGDKCSRKLQYGFHNCFIREQPEPRILRLFKFGTFAEDLIVKELEKVGIIITGRQETITGFSGHAFGYIDGLADNVPEAPKTQHLLEIKTHNNKNFNVLVKKGVRDGYKNHFDQCQRYMLGKKLTRTLYVGYNKDNSDIYFERIEFDKSYATDLYRKETHIIISTDLDPRLESKDAYLCNFCPAKAVCLGGAKVYENCRNCALVEKSNDGIWECTHHNIELNRDEQNEGCSSWRLDNMFVNDLI